MIGPAVASTVARNCPAAPPAVAFNRRFDKVASGGHCHLMRKVGLKVLKNKLSEYVRLVAAGETVVVTDRGRAVAEIVPPRYYGDESIIERGAREGWLTPAKTPFNRCRRVSRSPDTRWSSSSPISTAIGKI